MFFPLIFCILEVMNEFESPIFIEPKSENSSAPLESYRALDEENSVEGNQPFTPEELRTIDSKRKILSSLAYFIGKDFQMPVELNQPGAGWHWDFKANVIRVDPKDLLEKPMDYLRFVISHEGGHRRISRTDFIPMGTWQQPGFSFMLNAIEDPRDNNFVAENYPKFREQMPLGYEWLKDMEERMDEVAKDKLGYIPRFKQAGFEYIRQWFRELEGQEVSINETLPDDVREVVANTLESARQSWWTYPSRQEADEDDDNIKRYAEASYRINLDKIWPEFQKLVEKDVEDQKAQELLDDMQQEKQEGGESGGLPQEMKDNLTPEEQKELEEAIEKAIEEAKKEMQQQAEGESDEDGQQQGEQAEGKAEGKGKPIDLDSLSPGLKQKIKEFIDSLPEDKKQELQERAQKAISDFEKELDEEIEGKMSEKPEKKQESEAADLPAARDKKERLTEGESQSVVDYRKQLENELKKMLIFMRKKDAKFCLLSINWKMN